MKKMLIAVCAIALAAVAQAATVNWSATGLTDRNGTAVKTSDLFTSCSVVAYFYDASGETLLATVDNGTFTQSLGSFKGSWTGSATTTSYMAEMVITDKDGYTLTSDKAAFQTSASATYSINFGLGTGFTDKTSKFSSASWQAVPEPTSGLLLLLGMAGLALKRKRA